jgi:hypothetical protein
MIDLHGLNTSMLDNYCINWWHNTSVNAIFGYDSVTILLFYLKNGENGKNQYEVVKFSQPINNFIRQVVW